MRLIFGIILGVALTIGGAFILDTTRPTSGPDGAEVKPMVNWDVVGEKFKGVSAAAQDGWARLTGR
jgi:hypothetical protein